MLQLPCPARHCQCALDVKMPESDTHNSHTATNGVNHHYKKSTYAQVCETHSEKLSPLQRHVQFWDRDSDGVIWPLDVYRGFRQLGFGLFFSIGSLLIPIFFSYPTRLGHSWIPDPMFRIYVNDINKAKHGMTETSTMKGSSRCLSGSIHQAKED